MVNRDFLVQLHRNVGLWHEKALHNKHPIEKDLSAFLQLIEKEIRKIPKTEEYTMKSKFDRICDNLNIMCPVQFEYIFLMTNKELSVDDALISTTLSKEKVEELIIKMFVGEIDKI